MAREVAAVSKAKTIYEQTVGANDPFVCDDEAWHYVTVPIELEDRLPYYFRRGYTVADGHPFNTDKVVVIKIDRDVFEETYKKECMALNSSIGETEAEEVEHRSMGVLSAKLVKGQSSTLQQLVDRLPETDPDSDES